MLPIWVGPPYPPERFFDCGIYHLIQICFRHGQKFHNAIILKKEKKVFQIVDARLLAASVKQFKIAAPEIAQEEETRAICGLAD